MDSIIQDWWPIIVGAISYVVWLVRLEFVVKQAVKELARMETRVEKQRHEDREQHNREWQAMNRRLDALDSKIDLLPGRFVALMKDR